MEFRKITVNVNGELKDVIAMSPTSNTVINKGSYPMITVPNLSTVDSNYFISTVVYGVEYKWMPISGRWVMFKDGVNYSSSRIQSDGLFSLMSNANFGVMVEFTTRGYLRLEYILEGYSDTNYIFRDNVSYKYTSEGDLGTPIYYDDVGIGNIALTYPDAGRLEVPNNVGSLGFYGATIGIDLGADGITFFQSLPTFDINSIAYSSTNGTISGPSSASSGDTVTLTANPDTGYALSSIAIYKTASQDPVEYTKISDTTYTFTMPDADVTVAGVFVRVYAISIATSPTSGGAVSGFPSTARPGTNISFTVTPATNFLLSSYEFTGADVTFDRDTMTGSFVMPSRLVYGTLYFSSTNDPNDEGGTSVPGGGTDGTYDDKSDTVPVPAQPDTGLLYDVVGQGIGKGLVTVYNPTLTDLQDLGQWLYATSWGDALYQGIRDLFAKPIDALISLHILPYVPARSANKHAITLGPHNTGITSYTVTSQYKDVSCGTLRIVPYWDSYLDYSPYTRISLFLPYIGSVELNPDIIMGKLIGIRYRCDVITGGCVAYLFTYEEVDGTTVESIFGEYSGSMALSIPMTGSDFSQLISGFVSAVSSVAVMKGFAGSAMMNNAKEAHQAANAELGAAWTARHNAYGIPKVVNDPQTGKFTSNAAARNAAIYAAEERYGAAQDALNMARGQEQAVKSLANATRIATVPYTVGQVMGSKVNTTISGTITGGLGLLGSQTPYVIITRPRQSLADNYRHYVGYPCNMECVLSSLSGFTRVEQVTLSNVPCTEEELAMLYAGLKDGVYI